MVRKSIWGLGGFGFKRGALDLLEFEGKGWRKAGTFWGRGGRGETACTMGQVAWMEEGKVPAGLEGRGRPVRPSGWGARTKELCG